MMDINNIKDFFNESNENKNIVIYPFITKQDNKGSIIAPQQKWLQISKKLAKSKCIDINQKIYKFRNLIMEIDQNHNNDITCRHDTISDFKHFENFFVTIVNYQIITYDDFPKLKNYHDEYNVEGKIYKFGTVTMKMITINNNNCIEICVEYNSKNCDKIIQDLIYVDKIMV